LDLKPGEKKDVMEQFVKGLKTRGLISNERLILEELMERESLGSTGLERGIGIPHALIDEIEESFLALAVIKEGIDFEAVDQMPTYVLFLLLGNKNNPGTQLKVLAHVCRLVKETDFVEKLKMADSCQDICKILEDEEEKII
jgi:mannitol/fructose-specific phosphotransferase system IIA component (Ntr-type)